MLSKNKGQVLSRNDFRGDQRLQGSALGDIRQNNNKRPRQSTENSVHSSSRSNIHTEGSPSKAPVAASSTSATSKISHVKNNCFKSLKPQPDQTPSSSSECTAMASVGNDTKKENKRNFTSKESSSSSSICRDFLRNVCKRGSKCRFSHTLPDLDDTPQEKRQRPHMETNNSYLNKNEPSSNMGGANRLDQQKESGIKEKHSVGPSMQLKVMFCHDHQNRNGHCDRGNECRFIHCTRHEEEEYRRSGYLPPHIRDQAINKGISCDLPALFGARPICKDHLKKQCKRGSNCRFRHLTPMEYDLEITRCIQQQQQRQHENGMMDEHQDQLEQHQQLSQLQRLHPQQIPLSLNADNNGREVQHAYINSNGDANGAPYDPTGGNWDNTGQNNPGNYIDFVGPQDVKRCRYDHGSNMTGNMGLQLPQSESQGMNSRGSYTPTTEEDLDMIQQENILLKQRVEELKKQVTDLSTTNDFLLDQNAQLRLSGHSIQNRTGTTPGCVQTGQSAITTVVQAQHGGPLAVVPVLPPPTGAQVVESIGGPQQGQQQTIGHPQAGQLNQSATIQQSPVMTMSTITLAVPPPAMSMACQPSQGTPMSMAQGQQTTLLQQPIVASSIALPGPIQQNSPLTTSMSTAGPIQQTNLPSSISMAGPQQQSAPLPTSMRITGNLVQLKPVQHPNAGPQNSVNGGPQQIQATPLPTTMSMAATMQQTNQLQTSMNMSGSSLSHAGQHPGGGQPNGVTRSSQQTVSLTVQPLATAHSVSSMAIPLNSHPVQTNVAPPPVIVSHSQAMQAPPPPPQQQPQQPPPGMGPPPQGPQSSLPQPPPPPPQHVPPPGMQRTLQQQLPPVSVAVAGATSDTVTVRETRLITYPISSIQPPTI